MNFAWKNWHTGGDSWVEIWRVNVSPYRGGQGEIPHCQLRSGCLGADSEIGNLGKRGKSQGKRVQQGCDLSWRPIQPEPPGALAHYLYTELVPCVGQSMSLGWRWVIGVYVCWGEVHTLPCWVTPMEPRPAVVISLQSQWLQMGSTGRDTGGTQKAPPLLLQKKWHLGNCKLLDLAGAAKVSELGLRSGSQLQENHVMHEARGY